MKAELQRLTYSLNSVSVLFFCYEKGKAKCISSYFSVNHVNHVSGEILPPHGPSGHCKQRPRAPGFCISISPLSQYFHKGAPSNIRRSPGEGYGNALQYSCLENPTDKGAWQATVHRVSKSWIWLKLLSMHAQCILTSNILHDSLIYISLIC